jgi:hypothetical protein
MNQEDQSQPVYEKLDAGKMAEMFDAGGRIPPEGLEAQVENSIVGRDDRSYQKQFPLRDEQAEERAGDCGGPHNPEGRKPPEADQPGDAVDQLLFYGQAKSNSLPFLPGLFQNLFSDGWNFQSNERNVCPVLLIGVKKVVNEILFRP